MQSSVKENIYRVHSNRRYSQTFEKRQQIDIQKRIDVKIELLRDEGIQADETKP
jgi:hypothetical protein